MPSKVELALHLLLLQSAIERWVLEGAFRDSAYEAEATRLVEGVPILGKEVTN